MKFIISVITAALMMGMVASCSGGADSSVKNTLSKNQKRAYDVGYEDATNMLEQVTEQQELHLRLLDIRSRITTIKDQVSPAAAEDYENGFKNALEEHGDSLATILFE